ncbi:MAG: phytanoyl-CoA dioxygenase family protein [Rhodospirillales bacterium]|nr:phytanoyl-CoA dioxygenase family protein [Rhodospirillales bacterium]
MSFLTDQQKEQFERDGYVVCRGVLTGPHLDALRAQLDDWIEESRGHVTNWGTCLDGKARFDLEGGHTAEHPRLRRVSNPIEISEAVRAALFDSTVPDHVADCIGPDVKFHHCKINVKLPGTDTHVGWHQDHAYDPHTNDSMVTTLLFLSDTDEEMGPLTVVPGSHKTPFSHHDENGAFTGSIDAETSKELEARAVPMTGKAGNLVIMHTWMAHGGGPNLTDRPRALLICDYTAADAFALKEPAMPNSYHGKIVRGKSTRFARLKDMTIEVPLPYDDDSFFGLQGQKTAAE